jgi:hypothetical protein
MNSLKRKTPFTLMFISAAIAAAVLLAPQVTDAADKAKGPTASATKGQTLYTQFSMYYEDLCHRTTNYRKGALVPVNTEVTFVKASSEVIIVKLPDGQNLTIENVPAFAGENIDGIFTRTFSTEKVDLTKFTDLERKMIANGEVAPGMTKAAVTVAIGYPPKHKTPTLDLNQWRYWRNRFKTFIVNFDDGKVSKIQN